jgi:hypothetical protein
MSFQEIRVQKCRDSTKQSSSMKKKKMVLVGLILVSQIILITMRINTVMMNFKVRMTIRQARLIEVNKTKVAINTLNLAKTIL